MFELTFVALVLPAKTNGLSIGVELPLAGFCCGIGVVYQPRKVPCFCSPAAIGVGSDNDGAVTVPPAVIICGETLFVFPGQFVVVSKVTIYFCVVDDDGTLRTTRKPLSMLSRDEVAPVALSVMSVPLC